jgi:DNA-binding CsgD family transcriptional regulator
LNAGRELGHHWAGDGLAFVVRPGQRANARSTPMMDWTVQRPRLLLLLGAVSMFAALIGSEFITEEEILLSDVISELIHASLLVGCTVCSALLALRMRAQEEASLDLRRDLQLIHTRSEEWRQEMALHVRELGAAIQKQFQDWGLTPAEQEVGLLLLKGFSHKEIARLRKTSEATIRQQAASIYQKSSLNGRAALSAYFLEELLLPEQPTVRNGVASEIRQLRVP